MLHLKCSRAGSEKYCKSKKIMCQERAKGKQGLRTIKLTIDYIIFDYLFVTIPPPLPFIHCVLFQTTARRKYTAGPNAIITDFQKILILLYQIKMQPFNVSRPNYMLNNLGHHVFKRATIINMKFKFVIFNPRYNIH